MQRGIEAMLADPEVVAYLDKRLEGLPPFPESAARMLARAAKKAPKS